MQLDFSFCLCFPFGVLKTLHVLAPFALLVTVYLGPFIYSGMGFVLAFTWAAFLSNLFYLAFFLIGVQNKVVNGPGDASMIVSSVIPDFLSNTAFGVLFIIGTLISAVSMLNGIEHRFTLFLTYLFATLFCLISAVSMLYYVIRIYRACPNGNLRNLGQLVITGKDINVRSGFGYTESGGVVGAGTGSNPRTFAY